MQKVNLVILIAVCFWAAGSSAVTDPDPDMLGIYFDMTADENCLTTGASIPFFAYLILTNPTSTTVSGYEFGLDLVVPAGMEGLLFRLADYTFGCGICMPPYVDPMGGDYIVGLASPRPTEPATILHVWQYMLLSVFPVEYYLHATFDPLIPGDLPIVQVEDDALMQVGLSTGGPDIPVATVNTDCVVAAEELSLSRIKALYR